MRSIQSFVKILMEEPDRSVSFKAAAAVASTEIKQDGVAWPSRDPAGRSCRVDSRGNSLVMKVLFS